MRDLMAVMMAPVRRLTQRPVFWPVLVGLLAMAFLGGIAVYTTATPADPRVRLKAEVDRCLAIMRKELEGRYAFNAYVEPLTWTVKYEAANGLHGLSFEVCMMEDKDIGWREDAFHTAGPPFRGEMTARFFAFPDR